MSGYEKHIGKLKKVDLSKYNNSTERFFEEQYRKLVPHLSEEEIKEKYSWAENYKYRGNRGPWECLFSEIYYDFDIDIEVMFYIVNGNVYETIKDEEVDELTFFRDNGDGTYDYAIEFYNGGTWLKECIENELKKLK